MAGLARTPGRYVSRPGGEMDPRGSLPQKGSGAVLRQFGRRVPGGRPGRWFPAIALSSRPYWKFLPGRPRAPRAHIRGRRLSAAKGEVAAFGTLIQSIWSKILFAMAPGLMIFNSK